MNDRTIPAAARPCPRPALLERLTRGPDVIGIVHWGLNTFTGREWGLGDEDPALLAPAAFDADQIVAACKAGGLGGLVVVAKHHDGFCLWPTKTTAHNIARTPFWRDAGGRTSASAAARGDTRPPRGRDYDFRWPGNETGVLDPDSRATIETVGGFADGRYGNPRYKEQINAGSPGGAFFRACECDFPLRKGGFWRESERGTTKSGEFLAQRWLGTVGNGGTMNVGIAPDATGRLDDEDVRALARFGELRRALFAEPVSSGPANLVELREDVARGERVDGWRLFCGSREIARGRSVGLRRIRVFPGGGIPDAAELRAEATAFAGPEAPAIRVTACRADPALLRDVLAATAPTGETDTANWMTGAVPAAT